MGAESDFSHFKAFYERTKGEPWSKAEKPEKGQINSAERANVTHTPIVKKRM